MPAHLTLQGKSYNDANARREPIPDELHFTCDGVDLDYGVLTVYLLGDENDDNYTLASLSPYVNEDGVHVGAVGWKITPDDVLLKSFPDLRNYVGLTYGRPIITAGDLPVDRWNQERPTFELRHTEAEEEEYIEKQFIVSISVPERAYENAGGIGTSEIVRAIYQGVEAIDTEEAIEVEASHAG